MKNAPGPIAEFDIEFVKLRDGGHEFHYEVNKQFFEAFENNDVQDAMVTVNLTLDKQNNMIQADLKMQGHVGIACDRCLEVLNWPVDTNYRIIYKYQEEPGRATGLSAAEDNVELVVLPGNTSTFNTSQAVYESVLLDVPMIRNCDDLEVKPCNQEMLEKLKTLNQNGEEESDPRWDKLKDLLK